ncbi:MAG: hypothetical protein HQL72_14325 [Magnetococcales bacterium]|nr:hypothetical protein [Magnetococcales bacterium]
MEILNLIPIGFLVYVIYLAAKRGFAHGYTDNYFQTIKIKTGKKFANFFGIPKADM